MAGQTPDLVLVHGVQVVLLVGMLKAPVPHCRHEMSLKLSDRQRS